MPLFLEAGATVITRKGCVQSPLLWGWPSAPTSFWPTPSWRPGPSAPERCAGAGALVAPRCLCGLPPHRPPDPQRAGRKHPALLRRQPRRQRHALGAAGVQHPALIYGLPDYAAEKFSHYDLSYAGGRPLFATVGSFENRKGQDIFCKAIRLLPPETMKKASFLFVGKAAEAEMMDAVRSLTADCPDNVFYVKRLTRDEIKSLMAQCTCLVCASRDDPMPTFVTEGSSSASPPSCRSTPAPPAHHRGRGRFRLRGRRPRKAGRAAGLGHRAPGKACRHASRLP